MLVKLGSVSVLHLKTSQTWFCSSLTFESQSNLILFRSYTWKPVKLGSVPVLHLKAGQTCNFNFVICLLTWTYPSLPAWSRFWLFHACLLNWTYNSDANFIIIFFIHLDLPPGASSLSSFYLPGLTSECQFKRDFKSSSVGIWASLKTPILFEYYLLSPRRSFWSFYRMYDPFFTLHSCFKQENTYLMQGVM